ncbi:MAG: MBL fold metallo-hydrolase [Prochlorococcus sp. SP3034]|nr:MBL fold metallo-hydrolase [Prochlorococcus sp. SP3034]|tara:strand:- start:6216 stop:6929 length:714 start_codon:yes stop_codon:yes gene_type:complete
MPFKATYLGSNGWIVEFKKTKIVIDPWLKGDLVFPMGKWFFKGTLKEEIPTPEDINLILITQGLPDHCHTPTLKKFSTDVTVVCSESALIPLKKIGFENIKVIKPTDKIEIEDLSIEATSGAPVPKVENGYIIESNEGSFYIEPHGFLDKEVLPRKLDAVITPTKNLVLPIVGSFVKGADVISDLVKTFNPNYILSSTIGGDAEYSGILNKFITISQCDKKLDCKLIDLESLQSITI